MDRKTVKYFLLVGVVLLSTVLRIFWLSKSPPSLNWDEAALGYNAYSLLLTGKDEYANRLPITLRSFDDYKPAMYSYLATPLIKLFDLSEVSVRSVSAIMGVLTVITLFILVYLVTKNYLIALLSAVLVGVEPWGIFYSRGAWEANLSLTLTLISGLMLIKKRNNWAIFFSALNTLAYHSAKVYFFLIAGYLFLKASTKNKIAISLVSIVVVFVIAVSGGTERFASTGITKVLFESKSPYTWFVEVGQRYVAYFSPANLFVRGTNESGQKIPGFATHYSWELVFWVIGIVWLAANRKKFPSLFYFLIFSPIPAILTWSWFNPVRVLPLLAMHSVLVAIGLYQTVNSIKTSILRVCLGLGIFGWGSINLAWLVLALMWQLTFYNYGDWQWGFRETVSKISSRVSNVDKIVWETGQAQPYIFVLFYSKYPPLEYQKVSVNIPKPRKEYDFGKYQFRKIYWPDDKDLKKTLFVGGVYSLPEERAVEKTIDPQEYEMYRIVQND